MNRHLGNRHVMLLLSGTIFLGCGASQEQLRSQLHDMRTEMRDLTESHKALSQRCENLQNRLELVEDRSTGIALRRTVRPRLPVVRVVPKKVAKTPSLPPATITQDDLDRMLPKKVVRRQVRRPVEPPANAGRAGNVGVRRVPPKARVRKTVKVESPDQPRLPMGGPTSPSDDPIGSFKRAAKLFRGGSLTVALKELQEFGRRWPAHGYADNALMLVGKGRYQRAEYRAALSVFRRVLGQYPEGSEVPSALLMIGLTLDRLGQSQQATETLGRLKAMFPATPAGRRASQVLRKMSRRK